MRISHDSADTLTIFTKPSWLVMIVGVLMLLLAGVLAAVPAKAITLSCSRDKAPPICDIVETRLLSSARTVRLPLRLLRGAEAVPHAIGERWAYYRLNLDIDDGDGPYYFAWYGDRQQAQSHVSTIQAYLQAPSVRELRVSNDKRPPYYAIAGLLAFFGLVFVFWGSQRIRATFSRPDRQVHITLSGLLGTREQRYAMTDIRELDVAGLGGDCQLYFVLNTGRRIDLSTSTDTEGLFGPRRVRESRLKDAARLRDFCLVPPPVGAS